MAGIGFKLARMAQGGGIGGVMGAGVHGAVISAGPWLLTAGAVLLLQGWSRGRIDAAGDAMLQTVLIYAFSLSAIVAAPVIAVVTRAVSDRLYADDRGSVPGLLMAGIATVSALAVAVGGMVFGPAAGLSPLDQIAATAILVLLAQVWVANLFLTAVHRHRMILVAYLAGIATAAAAIALAQPGARGLLAIVALALAVTDLLLLHAIRRSFAAVPVWPDGWQTLFRRHAHIAAAGTAAALALWIDKWILWSAAGGGVAALGALRRNPVYDPASFLGLLSLVPGLTLMLIATETRFERDFGKLMTTCAGAGTIGRIVEARRQLVRTITEEGRLLLVMQATVACLLWVLAPKLVEAVGGDLRGVFAFRYTVVGCVFHLLVVFACVVLAYYDLFGRILIAWGIFALVSAVATIANLDAGFVLYGWSYMAGAMVAACAALAMVAQATGDLVYLLFVGNNPAVMGDRRRWA